MGRTSIGSRFPAPPKSWEEEREEAIQRTSNNKGGFPMRKAAMIIGIFVVCLAILWGFVWLVGSSNPYTPAGYAGYVTQGSIFGEAKYIGYQLGPKSWGRKWLAHVVNVPITTFTYEEFFTTDHSVLSKDDLKIQFNVHSVIRVKSDEQNIRLIVEKFAPNVPNMNPAQAAYSGYLKEPLRNMARDEIQSLEALKIKDNINRIGEDLTKNVRRMCENTPFDVVTVVVGNIQYPEVVASAVADKLAANQIRQKKEIEIEQADMDAKKRVKEAQGIADAMKIINTQLTWQYLQHEAIESQKIMANAPNNTVVYIPSGPMGVPMVSAFNPIDPANTTKPSK